MWLGYLWCKYITLRDFLQAKIDIEINARFNCIFLVNIDYPLSVENLDQNISEGKKNDIAENVHKTVTRGFKQYYALKNNHSRNVLS